MNFIGRQLLKIILILLISILGFFSFLKDDLKREAKVETKAVSDTMATTAIATGDIIDLGIGITSYGHCWSLSPTPTIDDSITLVGSNAKIGIFESKLKNLEPGKTYHIRAYIISGDKVIYGTNNLSFTTPGNPVYINSSIGNATPSILEITYDLTLANIIPGVSAFTVQVNSVVRTVTAVNISGNKVKLTIASAVAYGDIITIGYTKLSNNPLQTTSGGQAASITNQTVTNSVNPVSPVYLSSAIDNATPSILEMTYDLALANIPPATSSFTVQVNSIDRTVTAVNISGTKVMLTLANAVVFSDILTISYTKPSNNQLQTIPGGQAASITNQTVTNSVNPVSPVYVSSTIGNSTPSLLEMSYNLSLANTVPGATSFTVQVNAIVRTVTIVAISGTKVFLTLASAVVYGDVVTIAYTKPVNNPMQSTLGGLVLTFSAQTVTNNVSPVSPVFLSSVIENATPNMLDMTYDLTLANVVPAISAFMVKVNSETRNINSVSIIGTKVRLTLTSAAVYGDILTVFYTKPTSNPLQTVSGGQAATISAQPVTNAILCSAPSATTNAVTNISTSTARFNGTINAKSASTTVTFEYGTTTNYGSTIAAIQNPITGSNNSAVSAVVTNLFPNTLYYYRVNAANCGGTTNGNQMDFVTDPITLTDIEGNIYNVIRIGTQIWMSENLKTTLYKDRIAITNVTDGSQWLDLTTEAYCWYSNDATSYKDTYGALYNWYAVNTSNLCPSGWHVPNQADWTILANYLGGVSVAGGKLKEVGLLHWISPIPGATNESGFTGLPGGYRFIGGGFIGIGQGGYWWSSTDRTTGAYGLNLSSSYNSLNSYDYQKFMGFSVRCVKD
jgi:uncharacterized protein (TIGR02145 family)/uncharacterized repeat protein (TIGR02059 family)